MECLRGHLCAYWGTVQWGSLGSLANPSEKATSGLFRPLMGLGDTSRSLMFEFFRRGVPLMWPFRGNFERALW